VQPGSTAYYALVYKAPILGTNQNVRILVAHREAADAPIASSLGDSKKERSRKHQWKRRHLIQPTYRQHYQVSKTTMREKSCCLKNSSDELEDTAEEDNAEIEERVAKPHKRRWQVIRTFAAFAVFLCLLVVGIAWFFDMGWFSKPQTQAVNRTSHQKDAQISAPVTEDEKLKMALSMVAPVSSASVTAGHPDDSGVPVDITQAGIPAGKGDVDDISLKARAADQDAKASIGEKESYSLPLTDQISASKPSHPTLQKSVTAETGTRSMHASKVTNSDDARGRSLFFGIIKNASVKDERPRGPEAESSKPASAIAAPLGEIPFGTMLPVRLIGSIYTLRNSGGFVRMELTRPVEGKRILLSCRNNDCRKCPWR